MPKVDTNGVALWTLADLIRVRLAGLATAKLADKFLIPPFSVLDARQGRWQERKKAWLALGIKSELGRGENDNACPGGGPMPGKGSRGNYQVGVKSKATAIPGGGGYGKNSVYMFKTAAGGSPLKDIQAGDDDAAETSEATGTSIFDPVICELAYSWFCPPGGLVLDPFAGGSVRGIVASKLGRQYTGVDLRPEQAAANVEQAVEIVPNFQPTWVVGDAKDVAALAPGEYDLVFSCPPYADLERYSDDPRDLSTMSYNDFLTAYTEIIDASCNMLKNNRFACFVVGDVRDRKTGAYRGFVSDTAAAFRVAGLDLYNEAILVTSVGSLPIRIGRQFGGYRKLGKTHQQVLVFVKGDPGKASEACGPVEITDEVN